MPQNANNADELQGLSGEEVMKRQTQFGKNVFQYKKPSRFLLIIREFLQEPMFVLLMVACALYFILGQTDEGWMMLVAMLIVAAISVYQEVKSSKALRALKELTDPKVWVIRNGKEKWLDVTELVPGDVIVLEEGVKVPADATIIRSNDLTVNESVLTGESLPVDKSAQEGHSLLYQGTLINTGKCYAVVTATGNQTALGKIGKAVSTATQNKSLLQQQINRFVKRLALFGVMGFVLIFIFNYLDNGDFVTSFLFSLTLAMAVLPEEIPVAFSSFMALGAYHLSRLGIITRQPQVVESLGAVTVICLDKTGTITENNMVVESIYAYKEDRLMDLSPADAGVDERVLEIAVLASEADPFDPMEKAIWQAYNKHIKNKDAASLKMVYEYSLGGKPPMMTHIYNDGAAKLAAAKGAVERIMAVCHMGEAESAKVKQYVDKLAAKGSRILGVASAIYTGDEMPASQDDFDWQFEGLISLYDPPKKNIKNAFEQFYHAGINIKLLTGDHGGTAVHIADQVGLKNNGRYMTGDEVMQLPEASLQQVVNTTAIFARMFPEAKRRVVKALKANNETVAMTGDGVNDGPALKSADIGIAMGRKGTEIARQAASLILTDDNIEKMVEAIRQGRKIFHNLKKAVRYIISIHIPIILTASIPIVLGWQYPNIFTPIHVIFLELIMGPTCSIFFEREPVEADIMQVPPRQKTVSLFSGSELSVSIIQGVVIALAMLILYYVYMSQNYLLPYVRTLVFTTMVLSNILLTFVNRSFTETIFKTIRYKNSFALPVLLSSIAFLAIVLLVPAAQSLFRFTTIGFTDFLVCVATALAGVLWFELYKYVKTFKKHTLYQKRNLVGEING